MMLYQRLFTWLVQRINQTISHNQQASNTIGILDIYGFETFETNSFEQFCINYANEKLQCHFNNHLFKVEQVAGHSRQAEYQKEGVDWTYIDFVDNSACVALIEGSPGTQVISCLTPGHPLPA